VYGYSSLKFLPENIATVHRGLVFNPFNPFYEIFNEMIGRMIASGLVQHWTQNILDGMTTKREDEDGPQVLTLEQLEICFYVCIVPFAFCVAAFLLESATPFLKRISSKLPKIGFSKVFSLKSNRVTNLNRD